MKKTYLGDSVYVEYDREREGMVLTTENGYGATNRIFLEESVWVALLTWRRKLMNELHEVPVKP